MRQLATIQKIGTIEPIEGADKIECVSFQNIGWKCVSRKGEFQTGDLCVYIEVDSILPKEVAAFAFMENYKYRVKTIRKKKQISQGLALPFSSIPERDFSKAKEGDDVTALLGVEKYDPEIQEENSVCGNQKVWWSKFMKYRLFRKLILPLIPKKESGNFPTHLISKSDETRIQSAKKTLVDFADEVFEQTEKMEGQSSLFAMEKWCFKNRFYVCSRNIRLVHPNNSNYWTIAKQFNMKEVLEKILKLPNVVACAIQGEIIGEGIQGNIYKIKGKDFYVFRVVLHYKNGTKKTLSVREGASFVQGYGLKWVPLLGSVILKDKTVDDIVGDADGNSVLCETLREGKVYVCSNPDRPISFKAVSNAYLLLHGK